MNSPSERLTAKILERLVKEQLISPTDAQKFATELAGGRLRPEDWRLSIEMAAEKQKKPKA